MRLSHIQIPLFLAAFSAALLSGCAGGSSESNGSASPNAPAAASAASVVSGVYSGTIPCADCSGIGTTVILKSDGTYKRLSVYEGKGGKGSGASQFMETGRWEDLGDKLRFIPSDSLDASWLAVAAGRRLILLDASGKFIDGALKDKYELHRVAAP